MKIEKIFNKKKGVSEYQARFQLGGKEFRPRALTRKDLLETVDEIRARQHRTKFELPVAKISIALKELFERHAPTIPNKHQRKLFDRVSEIFLRLLPEDIKITELKKRHFQIYTGFRLAEINRQNGKPITPQTIRRELSTIGAALDKVPEYFSELEDYQKPIGVKPKAKKSNRTRLVNRQTELIVLLDYLRRKRSGKQTEAVEAHRRRLADEMEFRFETGLRRKEAVRLKREQYFPKEAALRNLVRWKTGTITKFFPLSRRAAQIIENRLESNGGEFIFTRAGKPAESDYRTLKNACEELKIPYGRYTENGFVVHDLRHNFASEIVRVTDIETAREMLGHSNIKQTGQYLHTSEALQREAIDKRENLDKTAEIIALYKAVRRRKTNARNFLETVRNLARF